MLVGKTYKMQVTVQLEISIPFTEMKTAFCTSIMQKWMYIDAEDYK